jgi:imidazolonepropionase-like amidohydrolase
VASSDRDLQAEIPAKHAITCIFLLPVESAAEFVKEIEDETEESAVALERKPIPESIDACRRTPASALRRHTIWRTVSTGGVMTTIRFRNVQVFPGHGDRLLPSKDVTIVGTTISSVADHDPSARPDEGTKTIDGRGRTLMPGLIDAHWHAAFTAVSPQTALSADPYYVLLIAAQQATATVLRGFTTVRDCGGPTFGLKRAIDEGVVVGPRIYPAGAMITQTSGHGDFRLPFEVPRDPCGGLSHIERVGGAAIADGVDQVLRAAREQLMLGASQLKMMAGGGVASAYDPLDVTQYTEAELRAGVEAAENWGTYVMVHAYTPRSVQQALRAGVRSIEHGHLLDEATVEKIAETGAWWCLQPFLDDEDTIPVPPYARSKLLQMLAGTDKAYGLAIKHRVKLAWGTDTLFSAELATKQGKQLAKMKRWFRPAEVLTLATSTNAELLRMSGPRNPYPGPLGRIEAGAVADMLLVDGDPLANLELIADPGRNLKVIVKNGTIVKDAL